MLTLTSRYAFTYTKVEGEVSVQQWGTILVENVSGCDAAEMTQSSLFVQKESECRLRTNNKAFSLILIV